jgi:hypothetical protein
MKKSADCRGSSPDSGNRGDRVTNPSDGGNTRANKFPGLARGEGVGAILAQNPIRATARGGSAAFFWKIAGDPGIFVRLYRCIRSSSVHSSLRVTIRERKVIFARARLTRGSKLFSSEGETERKGEREREAPFPPDSFRCPALCVPGIVLLSWRIARCLLARGEKKKDRSGRHF